MTTINVTPETKAALLQAVESNIDMLNDMALDDLWLSAQTIRELACKSDTEIRAIMSKNQTAAYKNMELLVNLQILYSELKSE